MALTIAEWFGHDVGDWSQEASADRRNERCPFINASCSKLFRDNTRSGVCSVSLSSGPPVVICPNRLYAGNYRVLEEIAGIAFGQGHRVIHPSAYSRVVHDGSYVIAFGKRYGSELRLPQRGGSGGYFVDWLLARISAGGGLAEFVAVEVQSLDTTGTYKPEVMHLRARTGSVQASRAGLNWENVNKRILPQIIYKGHALRRGNLCTKGLFFICPSAVYDRIKQRLGGNLLPYTNLQPGSLTFRWYSLEDRGSEPRSLVCGGEFPTTIDQVALAFTAPTNLPPAGVYEEAIKEALRRHASTTTLRRGAPSTQGPFEPPLARQAPPARRGPRSRHRPEQ